MADQAWQWVSVRQAADLLASSPSSIRRKIRSGELVSEEQQRPQGTRLLVRVAAELGLSQAPEDAPDDPPGNVPDEPDAPGWLRHLLADQRERDELIGGLRARLELAELHAEERQAADRERWRLVNELTDELRQMVLVERQARLAAERTLEALRAQAEAPARRAWWSGCWHWLIDPAAG